MFMVSRLAKSAKLDAKQSAGDKETFWLASELSSSNYTFMPTYASSIGTLTPIYGTNLPPAEPLNPFRSPLLNPDPPLLVTTHDPNDLKPRVGALHEVQHHRIPSSHPSRPSPMQICSTQALQLDHLGRPFWFNGSLRKNKNNKDSVEMGVFTDVMLGSANVTEGREEGWKMGPVSCLRRGKALELQGELRNTIDKILGEARRADVEVLGRNDTAERMQEEEKNKTPLSGWDASVAGDHAD